MMMTGPISGMEWDADEESEPQLMWDLYFEEWKDVNTLSSSCDISISYHGATSANDSELLDWDGFHPGFVVDEIKLRRNMRELRSALDDTSDGDSSASVKSCKSWWSLPNNDACYPAFIKKSGFKLLSSKAKSVLLNMWTPGYQNNVFSTDIFDDYETIQNSSSPRQDVVTKEKQTIALPTDKADTLKSCLQWVINHNPNRTTNTSILQDFEYHMKDQSQDWQYRSAASSLGYHTAGSHASREQLPEYAISHSSYTSHKSRDSTFEQEWYDARSVQSKNSIDGYEGLFANLDLSSLASTYITCFTSGDDDGKARSVASGCSFMENLAKTLRSFNFVSYYRLYFPTIRETNSYEESEFSIACEGTSGEAANQSITLKQSETTVPSHSLTIENGRLKQYEENNNDLFGDCSKPKKCCYDKRSKLTKYVSCTQQNTPVSVEQSGRLQESPKEVRQCSQPQANSIKELSSSREYKTNELPELQTHTSAGNYMSNELMNLIEQRSPSENAVYLEVKEKLDQRKNEDDIERTTATRLMATDSQQAETTDLKSLLKHMNKPDSEREIIPYDVINNNIKQTRPTDAMRKVDSGSTGRHGATPQVKRQFKSINDEVSGDDKNRSRVKTSNMKHDVKLDARINVDGASNTTRIDPTNGQRHFKTINKPVLENKENTNNSITSKIKYDVKMEAKTNVVSTPKSAPKQIETEANNRNSFTTYKPKAMKMSPEQDTTGFANIGGVGRNIEGYYLSATQIMTRTLSSKGDRARTLDGATDMTRTWQSVAWTNIKVGYPRYHNKNN